MQKSRAMTLKFFMEQILKSLLVFIDQKGFGFFALTAVSILFYFRAEATEKKMDIKIEGIETSFKAQIKDVESRLFDCNTEREKLSVLIAKIESQLPKKNNKAKATKSE